MKANNKIWTIIQFEFISRIKSKGFIISTLLGPIFLLAMITIPGIVAALSMNDTSKKIAVVDETGIFLEKIIKADDKVFFKSEKNSDALKEDILNGELDAFVYIPKDIETINKVNVFTPGGGGIGYIEKIENVISEVVREKRLADAGVNKSVIELVEKSVEINSVKVTKEGTQKDYTEFYSLFGYVLGFMIYILMFSYGAIVMRGVINEKSNRIIEIINSSAKSIEIMMGKIFGIGAVGLLQVLIWVVLGSIISMSAGSIIPLFMDQPELPAAMMNGQPQVPQDLPFTIPPIPIGTWIAFLFFFLAGYFLYSSLFAAVGSAVNQEEDAAQLQTPITMPLIIPILFMPAIMGNPDGQLAVILSLIPFFTPILMTARIAATSVPLWQVVLSVVLTLGTLYLSIWIASKIYRIGILMYGKKPTFKDLYKWIKIAK
jgi:ABC-2 type transport system permease protein